MYNFIEIPREAGSTDLIFRWDIGGIFLHLYVFFVLFCFVIKLIKLVFMALGFCLSL